MEIFTARRRRVLILSTLIAIMALGAVLRLEGLSSSFWGDEVVTRERALEPVTSRLFRDVYPLYHLLAHGCLFLGDNEVTLRLPALAAGLAGILAVFFIVKSLYDPTAGLAAALVLAVSPFHVFHSHHARYYTLLMLFGLLSTWFLTRAAGHGGLWNWAGYAVCAFLALMSHVFFLPALAAMNVGGVLYLLTARRMLLGSRKWQRIITLLLCTLVVSLPTVVRVVPKYFESFAPVLTDDERGPAPEDVGMSEAGSRTLKTPTPEAEEKGHFLSLFGEGGYLAFFKRYFWVQSPRLRDLLILFALWGLVDLFRNHRAFACVVTSLLVLTPLPFFYMSVHHWHHPRYYSAAYLPSLAAVAIGLMLIPTYLARAYALRGRDATQCSGAEDRVRAVECVLVALLLAALGPAAVDALRTYRVEGWLFESHVTGPTLPVHDWKGLYHRMAQTYRPEDVVFHLAPREHAVHYRRLYLERFVGNAAATPYKEYCGKGPDPEGIKKACFQNPFVSIWFTGQRKFGAGRYAPLMYSLCGGPVMSNLSSSSTGVSLWILGEPTENLIGNGGFERQGATVDAEGDGLVFVDRGYEGRACLGLGAPGNVAVSQAVSLPIGPMSYRLRNAGFELWKGGRPVGWDLSRERTEEVGEVAGARPGTKALALQAGAAPLLLSQRLPMGLAPGRHVRIEAMARADSPGELALALKYDLPGETRRVAVHHPGGGTWAPLALDVAVPADADSDSMAIEIRREQGKRGDAAIDDVTIEVLAAECCLDPALTYTLSMALRYKDLWRLRGPYRRGGFISLVYNTTGGESRSVKLAEFEGNRDWYSPSRCLIPGRTFPVDATDLRVRVGLENATGTLWIDNVQFEPKDHPTPFTEGVRPPHDEFMARNGLEPDL